jgi:hypothetical protein
MIEIFGNPLCRLTYTVNEDKIDIDITYIDVNQGYTKPMIIGDFINLKRLALLLPIYLNKN